MEAAWSQKARDGKMFARVRCEQCSTEFHFTDSPRVTRVPRDVRGVARSPWSGSRKR